MRPAPRRGPLNALQRKAIAPQARNRSVGDIIDRPSPSGNDVYNAETVVRTISAAMIAEARRAMKAPRVPRLEIAPEPIMPTIPPPCAERAVLPIEDIYLSLDGDDTAATTIDLRSAAPQRPSLVDLDLWIASAERHSRRLGAAVAIAALMLVAFVIWYVKPD